MAVSPKFISDFLCFLEEQEEKVIGWGFYDVAFDPDEIDNLFNSVASDDLRNKWNKYQSTGETFETLLRDMSWDNLLYKIPNTANKYRSRFAEGIRLLSRLKQRWSATDWSTAKDLISDIKVQLAKRRFPDRELTSEDIIEHYFDEKKLSQFNRTIIKELGKEITFSKFQARGFKRIFYGNGPYNSQKKNLGTVICAGTGTGKTKAFYLPAFMHVAREVYEDETDYTKVISVYPRNVLLADQLREAISEAGKLDLVFSNDKRRQLTFGALLGDTPSEKDFENQYKWFDKKWRKSGAGRIVPFLRAPFHPSRCELVWLDKDRQQGKTCLRRLDALDEEPEIPDGVLRITREDIQKRPPDFLFLSLEMLTRELSNPLYSKVFGIGRDKVYKPSFLLLDEVHSYTGLSGANAAWVIARWKEAAEMRNLHIVGLSATLKNAKQHLARLGCFSASDVHLIEPLEGELKIKGREYNIAVKGNAASGAPLLSTSIQVGMLYSRLMNSKNNPISKDSLGSASLTLEKTFAFTDQLDSLNRWFSDFRDAELNKRLAQYRAIPPGPRNHLIDDVGQFWELPEKLGHNLSQALDISRCSSQDPGANEGSDVILATASLEVGYDNPNVGVMLHHKTPISMSSFLQRKGRAGRNEESRPSTLVVLSDYGRDRWFFQNSELLFNPELEPIFIPIQNNYILRIQAVNFFIDWLGRKLGQPDPYTKYLSKPLKDIFSSFDEKKKFGKGQRDAIKIISDILRRGESYLEFEERYFQFLKSVNLYPNETFKTRDKKTKDLIDRIFWEEPRPLLASALPSLLRKLENDWRMLSSNSFTSTAKEDIKANRPLPMFIPPASFSELDNSDVTVEFQGQNKEDETRNVIAQLTESCPGRVSKRYSVSEVEHGYWLLGSERILQDSSTNSVRFSLNEICAESSFVGSTNNLNLYEPRRMILVQRPAEVLDSSNAHWNWFSSFEKITNGRPVTFFPPKKWAEIVLDCRVFLHSDFSGMIIHRVAQSGRYNLLKEDGTEKLGNIYLEEEGSDKNAPKECLGFRKIVDALIVKVSNEFVSDFRNLPNEMMARLRQDYFLHLLNMSDVLSDRASSFTLKWIWQSSLAMLTLVVSKNGFSLEEASKSLEGKRKDAADKVLISMFSSSNPTEGGGGVSTEEDNSKITGKLRKKLADLWSDEVFSKEVEKCESFLWRNIDKDDSDFWNWLKQRHLKTMAEAVLTSVQSISENINEDELIVDIEIEDQTTNIIVSETVSGGIGKIAHFMDKHFENERLFENGMMHALRFCSRSNISTTLNETLVLARQNGDMAEVFSNVRSADTYQQIQEARDQLRKVMELSGLDSSRSMIVSAVGKLLKKGSSDKSDAWSSSLNRHWRRMEKQLGTVIDERVFAYLLSESQSVVRQLKKFLEKFSEDNVSATQLFSIIQDFLLPNCHDSCPHCLENSNRFERDNNPSRELTIFLLKTKIPRGKVVQGSKDWLDQVRNVLKEDDEVELILSKKYLSSVTRGLQILLVEPIEREYLMVWPRLVSVLKGREDITLRFEIRGV